MKNKIIEFAKALEIDKHKDYETLRRKFKMTHNFSNHDSDMNNVDGYKTYYKKILKNLFS